MDIHSEMKRTKKGKIVHKLVCFIAATMMLMVFSPARATGAELKIIPSVSLMGSYSDNVFLTPDYHVSSMVGTAVPGITLLGRTEKLDVSLSARGKFDYYMFKNDSDLKNTSTYAYLSGTEVSQYVEDSSLNSISQYYSAAVGYAFTPRFRMTANAGWTRDYQPDRDVMETGLVMGNYKRDRFSAGVTGTWVMTEKLTVGAGYNFARDVYDSAGMSDLTLHQASGWIYYILTQKTKLRLNGGYGNYYYTLSTQETSMVWSTIGIEHQFHELWTISADAGARFAWSEYPVTYTYPGYTVIKNEQTNNWGGIARVALNYADDKNRLTMSVNYDLAPASSSMGSGPVQRLAFLGNAQRKLIYELSVFLSGGYYINRASSGQFGENEVNTESFRVSPGLRYEFTPDIALDLSYEYLNLHDRCLDTNAQRNMVMMRLFVQWPITL